MRLRSSGSKLRDLVPVYTNIPGRELSRLRNPGAASEFGFRLEPELDAVRRRATSRLPFLIGRLADFFNLVSGQIPRLAITIEIIRLILLDWDTFGTSHDNSPFSEVSSSIPISDFSRLFGKRPRSEHCSEFSWRYLQAGANRVVRAAFGSSTSR
jgi:hypothetical protein